MNERIRQLAEQAGINLPDDSAYNGHIYKNAIERFAGLIVQEMCQVMKAEVEEFDLDQNFGAVQGVGRCIKVVKQHFGVK